MEKIYHNNILVAMRISQMKAGSLPQTSGDQPLQLVTLKHPKGAYIEAHMHKPRKRVTANLQECLIVVKGKIKIDLYTLSKEYFKSIYLEKGQTLLLVNGGYGVHFCSNSELIELKNGPFIEDKVFI